MTTSPHSCSWEKLVYPAKTTLAALAAYGAARVVGLPEFYWAPITAVVVVQQNFAATLMVSWNRLAGTALGVAAGALLAPHFAGSLTCYALGLAGLGLLSAGLRLQPAANRFAAIAFSIVILIARSQPAWVAALHRFLEVSIGILAGMLLSAAWPEKNPDK